MKSLFVICVLALALQVYCGEYKPVIEPFDSTWTARWAIPAENQKDWEYGSLRGIEYTLDAVTPNKRVTANHQFVGYLFEPKQGGVVLQFEVQLQDFDWSPSQTGFIGAKLYRSAGYDITKGNDGPYTIAFGLNLESKKIKFDVAQWTPIHSEYRISSYASSVEFPTDSKVHYYTLHVKLNATFSIYIDGVKAHEGDFLKGWTPALVPPHGIPDPNEVPPEGWSGDIDNFDAEPDLIPDPNVQKPWGWDEDAPDFIPSPYLFMPVDWDEELDGPWEAPLIPNPACVVHGCGPWEAPLIVNPRKWRPTLRPNPEFFPNPNPHYFTPIVGVGLESDFSGYGRVKFDNVYLGFNYTLAEEFAERTFTLKKLVQEKDKRTKVPRKTLDAGMDGFNPYANSKSLWEEIVSGEAYLLYATVAAVLPFLYCVIVPRKSKPAYKPVPPKDTQPSATKGKPATEQKDSANKAPKNGKQDQKKSDKQNTKKPENKKTK